MSSNGSYGKRDGAGNPTLCPACGNQGRPVKPATIKSLVTGAAQVRVGHSDGFRFCDEPTCGVAYFHPETGDLFLRGDVKVRIGQKETSSPRPLCYCFGHTVEDIAAEVAKTGTSGIPEEITAMCRKGLDKCETTNPQGACCLGNVRKALKSAQAIHPQASGTRLEIPKSILNGRMNAGTWAQAGALVSAVLASACCWLPLLLIAFGVSGGALSATFEAWRPVLLPLTFLLLGLAFYFTYRKPQVATVDASGTGESCCVEPGTKGEEPSCCPPEKPGFSVKKFNKVALWVVTAWILAFAFFPNYVGYLLNRGGGSIPPSSENSRVQVQWNLNIDGMTCEACAVQIEADLSKVPGVNRASVNFQQKRASVAADSSVTEESLRTAVSKAGYALRSATMTNDRTPPIADPEGG